MTKQFKHSFLLSRTEVLQKLSDPDIRYQNAYKTSMCNTPSSCEYGSNCYYAHSLEELRKPLCLFFKYAGSCKKGNSCPYSHDIHDELPCVSQLSLQVQNTGSTFQQSTPVQTQPIQTQPITYEVFQPAYNPHVCKQCLGPLHSDFKCYYCLYHQVQNIMAQTYHQQPQFQPQFQPQSQQYPYYQHDPEQQDTSFLDSSFEDNEEFQDDSDDLDSMLDEVDTLRYNEMDLEWSTQSSLFV